MVADLEPRLRVPCTYPECAQSFNNALDMQAHKVNCPTHFYCKKCDVDCDSWVDLTQHKVDAMAPYLHARRQDIETNPKHIVCEFCGQDFKSMGGRKRHREQNHRADQNIVCPGCQSIFVRAWMMVEHLERNQCTHISSHDFQLHIQQKYIIREILDTLDRTPNQRVISIDSNAQSQATSSIVDEPPSDCASTTTHTNNDQSDGEDGTEGGVSLLDKNDDAQSRGRTPLRANRESTNTKHTKVDKSATARYKEVWPKLDQIRDEPVEKQFGRLTLENAGYASSAKSTPVIVSAEDGLSSAWKKGKSAMALFPDAKPTPPDAKAVELLGEQEARAMGQHGMLNHKFWNLHSTDFNAERFYDAVIHQYCCPFPACQGSGGFDTMDEFKQHIVHGHAKSRFHCPACLRVFEKPSSLIAHAESGGKCKIAEADNFKKLVEEISGGFLQAEQLPESMLCRPTNGLAKPGQIDGIMTAKYKAKLPHDIPVPHLTEW